jgi:hypothetical protein
MNAIFMLVARVRAVNAKGRRNATPLRKKTFRFGYLENTLSRNRT